MAAMKSLGLLSFGFFALAVTLSQNAARERSSRWYYGIVVMIFLIGLSPYTFAWLIPTLQLPVIFGVGFGLGLMAQADAGLVPETGGLPASIHQTAAGIVHFDTVVLAGLLAAFIEAPGLIQTA